MAPKHLLVSAAALFCALPCLAQHAPPAPDEYVEPSVAVVELYVRGQEFPKTAAYADRFAADLSLHGKFAMLPREDVARKIQGGILLPSGRANEEKLRAIEQAMEEGDKLLYTDPKAAVEVLKKAKRQIQDIIEAMSLNETIRKDFFKTQMLLARSHLDNHNRKKAEEVMAEVIRTFGDEEKVTEDDYHPNVVALYNDTFKKMASERTGRLEVTTEPPGCEVLINGRVRPDKTPCVFEGLYPGTYHVQTRLGNKESMVRKAVVTRNEPARVTVDLDYEYALAFGAERNGLVVDPGPDTEAKIADYASRLGAFIGVDYVAAAGLVGQAAQEGQAAEQGQAEFTVWLIAVGPKAVEKKRSAAVKPFVLSTSRVQQVAAAIADVRYEAPAPAVRPWYSNWVGWGLAGAGAASMGAGTYFALRYGTHKANAADPSYGGKDEAGYRARLDEKEAAESARTMAGVLLGAGAAAAAGGVLVFVLSDRADEAPEMTPVVTVVPWGGAVSVGGLF